MNLRDTNIQSTASSVKGGRTTKYKDPWTLMTAESTYQPRQHLMLPFWFFSYRISANSLTQSLCHLTVLGASHFPHTLSIVSSIWQILYLSVCLASYQLCSPSTFSSYSLCSSFPGFSLSFCLIVGMIQGSVLHSFVDRVFIQGRRLPILYLSLIFV